MKKKNSVPNLSALNDIIAYPKKSKLLVEIVISLGIITWLLYIGGVFSAKQNVDEGYIFSVCISLIIVYFIVFEIVSLRHGLPELILNEQGVFKRNLPWKKTQFNFIAWELISSAYLRDESNDELPSIRLVFNARNNTMIKITLNGLNISHDELFIIVEKYSVIHRFGFLRDV